MTDSATELILGIDPGSRHCGYGVIAKTGDTLRHVEHGIIHLKASWTLPERLCRLQGELQKLYAAHAITSTAVEKIFFGKNAASAFTLGHARGVCLLVSGQHRAPVAEYAATYVKKCVTGSGAATKDHVRLVVFNLLGVRGSDLAFDASDALSLAVTHARVKDSVALIKQATERAL